MLFKMIKFLDDGIPLSEYPRPQMKRNSYLPLNGQWEYAITLSGDTPETMDGNITVPYPPESRASGVKRILQPNEYLHYRRTFTLPGGFNRGRVLLNFGAVDQVCEVYVNGKHVGGHRGGYLPFSIEITSALTSGENELYVRVQDDANSEIYGRGKQRYQRGGIWYTPISGIWQSVWLESVPITYITNFRLMPSYENKTLTIKWKASGKGRLNVRIWELGEVITTGSSDSGEITLDVSKCKEWTPDDPQLYIVELSLGEDLVLSYFGLRDYSRVQIGDKQYCGINGKPIFHNGLLDQGYWESGIYTPPSNRAMYDEIKKVKSLGFNMLRKHIKIEPALWYFYCDVLGVLVWQDMINGGGTYSQFRINVCPFINLHINDHNYRKMKRDNPASREWFMTEAYGTIEALYNVVSLCVWTPFNEAWGQFDALTVWRKLKSADSSRLFDHASGWQDKGGGDFKSRHIYFRKVRLRNDKKRVLALTEFGGYSYALKGHVFSDREFGYKRFVTAENLTAALDRLYRKEIIPLIEKRGLCATVYTQLTDIEDEVNGLFTYDRVLKVPESDVIEFNKAVYNAFDETVK